jgi:hypothetical protein
MARSPADEKSLRASSGSRGECYLSQVSPVASALLWIDKEYLVPAVTEGPTELCDGEVIVVKVVPVGGGEAAVIGSVRVIGSQSESVGLIDDQEIHTLIVVPEIKGAADL